MDTFEITRLVLGCRDSLPLEEKEFVQIRDAAASLLKLLEIEEDYDILVESYLELEETILSVAIRSFVKHPERRIDFDKDRRLINRRIANLLASARAFIDHSKHYISGIPSRADDDLNQLCGFFSQRYDSSLGYRLMETLRNYVQHRGLPTQGFSYRSRWADPGTDRSTLGRL